MSGARVVALDVGSSSVRAAVYDEHGVAEPGEARLAYSLSDADELVAACTAVLAQVGEGDELAISCFWHSLVAVDEHDHPLTPVLTWRDLGGSSAGVGRGRLPPPHRLLRAPRLLAGEDPPPPGRGPAGGSLSLVRRLPAASARG